MVIRLSKYIDIIVDNNNTNAAAVYDALTEVECRILISAFQNTEHNSFEADDNVVLKKNGIK